MKRTLGELRVTAKDATSEVKDATNNQATAAIAGPDRGHVGDGSAANASKDGVDPPGVGGYGKRNPRDVPEQWRGKILSLLNAMKRWEGWLQVGVLLLALLGGLLRLEARLTRLETLVEGLKSTDTQFEHRMERLEERRK